MGPVEAYTNAIESRSTSDLQDAVLTIEDAIIQNENNNMTHYNSALIAELDILKTELSKR